MATQRKTSGYVLLAGWAIVAVLAIFYVAMGEDWYANGHLRMCRAEDLIREPDGSYRPPATPEALSTPRYWCALQSIREKAGPAGRARPFDCAQDLSACLTPATGADDAYFHPADFWGNDIVSQFFHNLGQVLLRWAEELWGPFFRDRLAPAWNRFFADDDADPSAAMHRLAFVTIAAAIFATLLTTMIKLSFDWIHEKMPQEP